MLEADCMFSFVTGSDSNGFFLWEHLKDHIYAVPVMSRELMTRLK
jgi:hypothetical protein